MEIRITKQTPYRKGYEKEVKVGEIHKITRTRKENIMQSKAYFFIVDGKERMALYSDCELLTK